MLTILILTIVAVMMLVLALLAVVVAAVKQEPQGEGLTSQAPSVIASWVRRLLGLYVRKPHQTAAFDPDRGEPCSRTGDPSRWPRDPAE
jgi:hypothetical protein